MDQQVESTLAPLHRSIEDLYEALPPSPLRAKAFAALSERGLATKKDEAFSYVPFTELYNLELLAPQAPLSLKEEDIAPFIAAESTNACIVFVDGIYSCELSRLSGILEIQVTSGNTSGHGSYSPFLQKRVPTLLSEEQDPFTLINLSLSPSFAFIFIPQGLQLQVPIQCLFIETGAAVLSTPRLHLALGKGSSSAINITEACLAPVPSGITCPLIDISLDEASRLQMTNTCLHAEGGRSFVSIRGHLRRDAAIDLCSVSAGSCLRRESVSIVLAAEGARAAASGLTLANKYSSCHSHVVMDHRAPHCISNQLYKAALTDAAKTSFTGKIHVRQPAQKTEAYQLNNNLLLSQGCLASSKPGLEILADDVKASHGATIAQLDDEQLFYLASRGLVEEEARSLMLYGFCQEITQKITQPSLQPILSWALARFITS